MQTKIAFYTACLFLAFSGSSMAQDLVSVRLGYPADGTGARMDLGEGEIEVVIANAGNHPVDIDEMTLPKPNPDGILFGSAFEVIASDGSRAIYTGINISTIDLEGPYLRIPPKGSLIFVVDLARNYGLHPGTLYRVQMKPVRYLPGTRDSYANYTYEDISEVTLKALHVAPISILTKDDISISIDPLSTEAGDHGCNESQLEDFETARQQASSMSSEAPTSPRFQ